MAWASSRDLALAVIAFMGLAGGMQAGEFDVSSASYLGGGGSDDAVRGVCLLSDGTIVLAANLGDAAPGAVAPILLDGATETSGGALVRLAPDGRTVLSVTRVAAAVYDLASDAADKLYVAAGTNGLLKLDSQTAVLEWKRLVGEYVYRVDAGTAGDVAGLVPGDTSAAAIDTAPGVGTITLFAPDGTQRTRFQTWGGRHALDLCVDSAHRTVIWIGWRNGYAYNGPYDGWPGTAVTVHIASVFGVSYDYDGANWATELKYHVYDWPENSASIWLDPVTLTLNPRFLNGPIDLSQTYTLAEVTNAAADALTSNDWLTNRCTQADIGASTNDWITQNLLGEYLYVGRPRNLVYQREVDSGHDPKLAQMYVGYPKTLNSNMADTRGYRCSLGRDGLLYCAFESAGGNNIFRRSSLDLAANADNAGGDMFQQVYNAGSAHIAYVARFDPTTGAQLRGNYAVNRVWNGTVWYSNTLRVERGDLRADEGGNVVVGGTSAWGLPMWPHGGYTPKAGETTFNPFGPSDYLGGAWLMVLSSNFATRSYVTRLSTDGRTCGLDARTVAGGVRRAWGGYTQLGQPMFVRDAVQPAPGYGSQDGFVAVLGGGAAAPSGDGVLAFAAADFSATDRNFRDTLESAVRTDVDGDGEDDSISEYPFSATARLSPVSGYVGPAFFGGVRALTRNDPAQKLDARTGCSAEGDTVVFIQPDGSKSEATKLHYVLYFDKADMPGDSAGTFLTFNHDSRLEIGFSGNYYPWNARWLVRDAGTFYVSEATFNTSTYLSFASDRDDGRWAVFALGTSMDFDQGQADFANRNFTDVTAVGFIEDSDAWTPARYWMKLDRFGARFATAAIDNQPPVARFSAQPALGSAPLAVTFDAAAASDPDGTVSFLTWAFGDGETSAGRRATHTYDAAGNYLARLQVWDDRLGAAEMTTNLWVTSHLGGDPAATVAAWGGNLANGELRRYARLGGVDLDADGTNDDSRAWLSFSATEPLSPASGDGATPFHGGFLAEFLNTTTAGIDAKFITGSAPNKILDLRYGSYGTGAPLSRGHGLLYVDQAAFLNGADALPVGFDSASELRLAGVVKFDYLGTVRWLVREGASFAVSEAVCVPVSGACVLTFPADGDDGRWAPYDPSASLDFDVSSAVFASRNFTNLTAVGLVFDRDSFTPNRAWLQFSAFRFLGRRTPHPNDLPTARFTATPTTGAMPLTVAFDATASSDADGAVIAYRWDFGDGGSSVGPSPRYTYVRGGNPVVSLTVTDDRGGRATATTNMVVQPTRLMAAITATPGEGSMPITVSFRSGLTHVPSGATVTNWLWRFGDGTSANGEAAEHTYEAAGVFTARLTVWDDTGASDTAAVAVPVALGEPVAPPAAGTLLWVR